MKRSETNSPIKDTPKRDKMDIRQASEQAKKRISEALDKKAENTNSISKEGNEWSAMVEVLEEEYIPGMGLKSMNDLLGIYEVRLNEKGELEGWNKRASRKRGEAVRS